MREACTQAELDAHLKEAHTECVLLLGDGQFEAWDSSHVVAWGSSHVVAWGSSHVEARDSSHVEAGKYTSLDIHSSYVTWEGSCLRVLRIQRDTLEQWFDYYGLTPQEGLVTLYKAVRDDLRSGHGFLYALGTMPTASDWDGGKAECGGGLHLCATPRDAKTFDGMATRYLACPVNVVDIVVTPNAIYPNKVKVPRIAGPIFEVDIDGKPL